MKFVCQFMTGLFFIIFFSNCNSEEVLLTTDRVFAILALDAGDNQNSSDILTTFRFRPSADTQPIQDIRIMLIPSAEYINFDPATINSLSSELFHSVQVNGDNYRIRLPNDLIDLNGNRIKGNQEYTLLVAVVIDGRLFLNEDIATVTLKEGHFLDGKYTGTWNDNLYTNFPISAELTFKDKELKGAFYYTVNFSPCCGGSNDGRLILKFEDDEIISSFEYQQVLDSFQGGLCSGNYTGKGRLKNIKSISIDFTGDDCEGPHTNGKIELNLN